MTDEKRGDSLGRAISDIRRDSTRAPRPNSASVEGAGGSRPGLEHILAGEFGGEVRAAARQNLSERPARTRGLAELAEESRTPAASQPATQPRPLSRPIIIAVLVFVLLLAILVVPRGRVLPGAGRAPRAGGRWLQESTRAVAGFPGSTPRFSCQCD